MTMQPAAARDSYKAISRSRCLLRTVHLTTEWRASAMDSVQAAVADIGYEGEHTTRTAQEAVLHAVCRGRAHVLLCGRLVTGHLVRRLPRNLRVQLMSW